LGRKRIFTLQINKKALILISVIFLLSIGGCRSKKDAALPPRIVFLNYNMAKESDGSIKIEFINSVIAEGKLKEEISGKKSSEYGDLKIIQVNAKSEPLQSIILSNPLVKNVEYLDESGGFQRKIIVLESTEFSVRTRLNDQTIFIIIEKINKENKRLIV
jgi:hypothetical protein